MKLDFMGVARIIFVLMLVFVIVMFAATEQAWPKDILLIVLMVIGASGIYATLED